MLFGGLSGGTHYHSFDFDFGSGSISVSGGRSDDLTLVTVPSPIVVYICTAPQIKWTKQLLQSYDYVSATKFNIDRDKVLVSLNQAPLLLYWINTGDGSVINSFETNSPKDYRGIHN